MSFHLKTRRRKFGPVSKSFFAVLALFLVFSAYAMIFPNYPKRVFTSIGIPLWQAEDATVGFFSSLGGYFANKYELDLENQSLKERLNSLEIQVLANESVIAENLELRESLGRTEGKEVLLSYVLQTPGFAPYDYLIIDQGEQAGVKIGEVVTIDGIVPIGTVASVSAKTSMVKLYSSPGEEIEGVLQSEGSPIKAKGAGAGTYEISVPKDTEVIQGDQILLPGGHHAVLAVIEKIEGGEAQTFKTVFARTPIAVSLIKKVIIIRE